MNLKETLDQLEALGDDKMLARNSKNGVGENQYGVKLGDIKKLAKKIKFDHQLALSLWDTKNLDARLLATLIIKTKELTTKEMDTMVQSITTNQVADWFNAYMVKIHPEKENLRHLWMTSKQPMASRAGWNLTASRIARDPKGMKIQAILDRLESEMGQADPKIQWTMNSALAQIGIEFPDQRKRAIEIGEKLGIYRDYPVSKGCTSPFAPIWIKEMVSRQ